MQIPKISLTKHNSMKINNNLSSTNFGMSKTEKWEHDKYQLSIYADYYEKNDMDLQLLQTKAEIRNLLNKQLEEEPDLTVQERAELERDRYLLNVTLYELCQKLDIPFSTGLKK